MGRKGKNMTLEEVRKNIDRVDGEIRRLFIERMGLAEQVARIKAETEDAIYKPEREAVILEKQSQGMDPHLVKEYKALVKRVMEVSRKYQYGRTLELRDCFPFSFETEETRPSVVAMCAEEVYICPEYARENVRIASDYREISGLLENGSVDAGAGIIEEVGKGVSDELNGMLASHRMYINRSHIVEDRGEKKKVVEFSTHLVVTKEHNRLKLVFVCPNRSGMLGSILSMISDYGVNMTEIHSMPYKEKEDWNYRFFVELSVNLLEPEAKALLFQLSEETQKMQILGSYYCDGDFATK